MKREIKFRYVWQHEETGNIVIKNLDIFSIETVHPENGMQRYSLIDRLEFTGLKDKDGKEIYEGDILKECEDGWTYGPVQFKEFELGKDDGLTYNALCFAVEYSDKSGFTPLLQTEGNSYGLGVDYCHVIGNIYENPNVKL